MREVFAELRGRTAAKVWAAVRGKEWLALDTVYGPIDAPRLVDAARGRGLRVEVRPTDTISYLPHNTTTGVALLIEDDEEAAVIANRMLAEGVPVDREEID
jgi:hypothetical protein